MCALWIHVTCARSPAGTARGPKTGFHPTAADCASPAYSTTASRRTLGRTGGLSSDFLPRSTRRPNSSLNSSSSRKKPRPGWAPGSNSTGMSTSCRLGRRSQKPPAPGCGAGCKSRRGFPERPRCLMQASLLPSGHGSDSIIRYCGQRRAPLGLGVPRISQLDERPTTELLARARDKTTSSP